MPVIADTSQEASLRLHRAAGTLAPTDDDRIRITTGWPEAAGFRVSDELLAAYEADLPNPAPALPDCRAGNPCYSPACQENVITDPPVFNSYTPLNAAAGTPSLALTVTGTNFTAPMTATLDPPGAEAAVSVPVTVVSPTQGTLTMPGTVLDTAGTVTIALTTPYGTTATRNFTVNP